MNELKAANELLEYLERADKDQEIMNILNDAALKEASQLVLKHKEIIAKMKEEK